MGATHEVLGPADAYMLGHSKIGDAVRRAGLFAASNSPFMPQNTRRHNASHDRAYDGGLPLGRLHFVNAITEVSSERFVTEPLNPSMGLYAFRRDRLGVELDRAP